MPEPPEQPAESPPAHKPCADCADKAKVQARRIQLAQDSADAALIVAGTALGIVLALVFLRSGGGRG